MLYLVKITNLTTSTVMTKISINIGDKFVTNEGYNLEVVTYTNSKKVGVRFDDGEIINVGAGNLRNGFIKNRNHKSKYGYGYYGYGKYLPNENKKAYQSWKDMFKRCYDEKLHLLKPYYEDCTVCEEWHNFQNFAEWFNSNYIEGCQIDKDLLIKNNRVYSPDACCFLPLEINVALVIYKTKKSDLPTGVSIHRGRYEMHCGIEERKRVTKCFGTVKEASDAYVIAKESYIKRLAEKFKPTLTDKVYNALMNWNV